MSALISPLSINNINIIINLIAQSTRSAPHQYIKLLFGTAYREETRNKCTNIFVVVKQYLVMDDPFVSCPYEPSHRVPRSRIQGHIVKCQKRYPELKICPYNATHRFPEDQIKAHVINCPSRAAMFPKDVPANAGGALTTPKPILQSHYLSETDPNYESWD